MSNSTPDPQPVVVPPISYQEVELYGGAMHCKLPTFMQDVSCIRQVPDNQ